VLAVSGCSTGGGEAGGAGETGAVSGSSIRGLGAGRSGELEQAASNAAASASGAAVERVRSVTE
jgi:hypothetical protein